MSSILWIFLLLILVDVALHLLEKFLLSVENSLYDRSKKFIDDMPTILFRSMVFIFQLLD